jgi:hypothetical protein
LRQLFQISVAAVTFAVACTDGRSSEPPRPSGLPVEAFWLGGSDGGVFLTLSTSAADSGRRTKARIFHPDGSLWYDGTLVIEPDNSSGADLADRSLLAGWDGKRLLLTDGRAFRALSPTPP